MLLTLPEFVARWQASTLSERSAAQPHFLDLCDVLGEPHPAASDPQGTNYTFEKGVSKIGGGQGYADVWKRGHFAWEYKGKHKNLDAAYQQLLQYREDLENPPLLVVCDLDTFEVHTNFTNTAKTTYTFKLADLLSDKPLPGHKLTALEVLRSVFTDYERLRPGRTTEEVTEAAAAQFAKLAESLSKRGHDPEQVAHFLMRLLFCLFAEDIGNLLPNRLFTRLLENTRKEPDAFNAQVSQLFGTMAKGGYFGTDRVPYFNGGLFNNDQALDLLSDDIDVLLRAARLDWSSVEPAIFGTLFERSLDPSKRSQLGAHYTSRDDILLIVEPVLMEPLRRRWREVQEQAQVIIEKRESVTADTLAKVRSLRSRHQSALEQLLLDFQDEIHQIRVLDPACGSGNFLYVALKSLLDLQWEVARFASNNGLQLMLTSADPSQLYGIETNSYAYELASVVVWIGYIQWLYEHGFGIPSSPILQPLHNIKHIDAILAWDENHNPVEPEWPEADVIIGNPPFLGGKQLRQSLGPTYVDDLYKLYGQTLPRQVDLVTFWFERARRQLIGGKASRVGLLATQAIRGGVNRVVLENMKRTGDIFMAWSDRPWTLEGAAVHVSMIGFDHGAEQHRVLDGSAVAAINTDLTSEVDLTQAKQLRENAGICLRADEKGGSFDIDDHLAQSMLRAPLNVNQRPNADVVLPWINALDITRRPRRMWIIDFHEMSEAEAAEYELPFAYVRKSVYPERQTNNDARLKARWWLHRRPGTDMRKAVQPLSRYVATPLVSKHRVFVWMPSEVVAENLVVVIAREDDYFFGVLQSKPHELWALRKGSALEDRPRYTPTTTFETFPFPWSPGNEPQGDPKVEAIAQAARELVEKRDRWLNPEGASEAELKKRTLTNLYNERPTWLQLAHEKLDRAVLDAYGWPHDLTDEQILERLLALNLERAHEPTT